MPQYRKQPVEIEARQWDGTAEGATPIIDWILTGAGWAHQQRIRDSGTLIVRTLEGDMSAGPTDWIIRGVKGEFYPCRDDIFQATYQPADLKSLTERLAEHLRRSGSVVMAWHPIETGTYSVASEWGQEAPGSPMAGAAAIGSSDLSLDAAIEQMLSEVGL